jgi:SAM-dependent methyltransferase
MSQSTLSGSIEQMRRWLAGPGNNPLRAAGVVLDRGIRYLGRRLGGARPFDLGGERFIHLIHPFILDNERTVEIPLALRLVERRRGGRVLEVGNVLAAYRRFEHTIVDKYEKATGVINADIVDYRPDRSFDLILCLSTLEHVGWDETPRDDVKIGIALAAMSGMLAPGGELLVTMPLGYNTNLDGLLEADALPFTERRFLKRISSDNRWVEATWPEVRGSKFGTPFGCANAIVVGRVRASAAGKGTER